MEYGEVGYERLKKAIRTASSRKFGVVRPKFELLLFALIASIVVGVDCISMGTQPLATRLVRMACAATCVMSVLIAYRTAVPFVLWISYADMLRIRRPFYVWMYCAFLVVCLSDPFWRVISGSPVTVLPVALTIMSVGQVFEYFRKGRPWHLFLAYAVIGVTVGLSSLGVCALVIVVAVSFLIRRGLFNEFENGVGLIDEPAERIVKKMVDPYEQMMLRMVSAVCFFIGMSAIIAVRLNGVKTGSVIFGSAWMRGVSVDGLVVILAGGVVPLAFALNRIGKATDLENLLGFGNRFKYVLVGCASLCYLQFGGMLYEKVRVAATGDSGSLALGAVIAGFALLLSATVALVDIWCRMPLNVEQFGVTKDTALSRLFRRTLVTLPIGLAVFAFCMRCFR